MPPVDYVEEMYQLRMNLKGYPACWEWPVYPLRTLVALHERDLIDWAPSTGTLRILIRMRDDPLALLGWWQAKRCAICGTDLSELVCDHDHRTGLVRGYLCRSCNTLEAHNRSLRFARYRGTPPAVILGLPPTPYVHPFTGEEAQPMPDDLEPMAYPLGL